jgi:SAM-dependent methyltransferase
LIVRRDWKDRPVPLPPTAPTVPSVEGTELQRLVGERTVPQLWHENYWFRRHEIAYLALASSMAQVPAPGRSALVVEAGSGEGYGVRLLRDSGIERVVALDYDAASLAHARATYPDEVGGRALRSNLVSLPLADSSASAITCLQVIEHLWTPGEFLAECARVLRPGGVLAVSTPNRLTFSVGLGRGERPANPFHCREFDAVELRDLIAEHLEVTDLLGIRHGDRHRAWQARHGVDPVAAQLKTSPDRWPADLADLIRSVTADDFVLEPLIEDDAADDVLDLVVLARRAVS